MPTSRSRTGSRWPRMRASPRSSSPAARSATRWPSRWPTATTWRWSSQVGATSDTESSGRGPAGASPRPSEGPSMEQLLALEMVRVTEAAAIESARFMGRGDRTGADRAATEAMRKAVDEVDIAVDPLEGTNLVATGQANAITVIAASEKGGLVHAPDTYLEKLCVGPVAAGHVDLTKPAWENVHRIAESLGRKVTDITVIILDRPRHEGLIAEIRKTGARIKLITDGDLSAAISCAVQGTGVHAVMGIGGAPEGVITAAAMRCLGGEIQARLRYRSDAERERGARMGHGDESRVYRTQDLASGESIVFAATGVTDGDLLQGIRFFGGVARSHSMVMAYQTKQVRFVDTVHMFDRDRPPAVRL